MNRKTFAAILLPLVFFTFTMGCSTIKGWFGKDKTDERPPEVLAAKGIKDLKKKNYDDAIETFEKVRDRYPYSEQALLAQLKVADAYFFKKKYDEAFQAYREFEKLHPTNKAVPYCIYREGLSYYRQRSTIDRDQTYTTKALEELIKGKQITSILARVDAAAGNLEQLTARADKILGGAALDKTVAEAREALSGARSLLTTLNDQVLAMKLPDTLGKTRELTRELQATSQNLRQSSETLEMLLQRVYDRPSDLLFGKPPKKRWNE